MLGKHKEEKKEVAIKFMDVSENRKYMHWIKNYSCICKYDIGNLQRSRVIKKVKP
jgi:hypothetical protein